MSFADRSTAATATTAFLCRDCGRRYEAPTPLAEQRWAKGGPCQMCGGRLRFPFGTDADADAVVAAPPRCLVCSFVLPPSGTPYCSRCDVAHVVVGTTAARAPVTAAEATAVAATRAKLSSSPRARLIDLALAQPDVGVASVVAAEAFVVAEAATVWTPHHVPLPLDVARDVCEHLLLFRGRTVDARTVGFTIVDGIERDLLADAHAGAVLAALGGTSIDLDVTNEGGDGQQRPMQGVCTLRPLTSTSTSLSLRPVLRLAASADIAHTLWMFVVGARLALSGFKSTLAASRPAVLSWLTRSVLLGAGGRAPTVATAAALTTTLAALLPPSSSAAHLEGLLALLDLPPRRFPPQDHHR